MKKIINIAAVFAVSLVASQAATVFSDTFLYTADNAFIAEGGWTTFNGTIGTDGGVSAGVGRMWGNGHSVEYDYTVIVAAGDVITMDANVDRTGGQYHYTMSVFLWDGVDAGTRTLANTSDQNGVAALAQLSYMVNAADISAGHNQVIFQYAHSENWGETEDVTFGVTTVPEPSSAALLGLGGLALILRRRK